MSVWAGGDVSPHMESRFVRWTSGMVLSSTSLSMVVYSFMHLPAARRFESEALATGVPR